MTKHARVQRLVVASLVLTMACTSDDTEDPGQPLNPPTEAPTECNPVAAEWSCTFPFPSDYFTVSDPSTLTKRRVVIPKPAQPVTITGNTVDLYKVAPADGFSVLPQLVVALPEAIDSSNLVSDAGDVTQSTTLDSPVLLIDTETGEKLLHHSQQDFGVGQTDPTLLVLPLERLKNNHRYVVLIHKLKTADSKPLQAPAGFQSLRDGTSSKNSQLNALRNRYEDNIFPVAEQLGIEREKLQLAWDFTTRSQQHTVSDVFSIVNQAMAEMEVTTPTIKITKSEDNISDLVGRRIEGTMTVPLYTDTPEAGAVIHRDSSGEPTQNGMAEVPFTIIIPKSITDKSKPANARLLQFGHGFFGARSEIEGGFVTEFANQTGMVVIGVDWWGMSEPDMGHLVVAMGSQPAESMRFTERVSQGFVNALAVSYAAKNELLEQPELMIDGEPAYDPKELYFYGLSQGHILGGCFLALSPHIKRGILSSGGGGFSILMARALPFISFGLILDGTMSPPRGTLKFVTQALTTLDRIDPGVYASYLFDTPLSHAPGERKVLMQAGLGDSQVPNASARYHARTLDLPYLEGSPVDVPGLSRVVSPTDGSAYVEFDFGHRRTPGEPLEQNEVHEGVRRLQAAIKQGDHFLRPDGKIKNFCDGTCDPE